MSRFVFENGKYVRRGVATGANTQTAGPPTEASYDPAFVAMVQELNPDEPTWSAVVYAKHAWLRGFRRQGQVTDAEVEAAARRLYALDIVDVEWDSTSGSLHHEVYLDMARAALEAARTAR